MSAVTPFLWFDDQAEEAARFYVSLFKKSRMGRIVRFGDAGPGKKGAVMTVSFRLDGTEFTALNGGPRFKFTEAISFAVTCKTQKEIDDLWTKLSRGGEKQRCGWLKDKYGLSWQVIPAGLGKLLEDPNAVKAMLEMDKLDIARLKKAAASSRRRRR
jgi:predicted 3-demethylubiquinone-9 3-methyltransferase (glyoxalase superfamily)